MREDTSRKKADTLSPINGRAEFACRQAISGGVAMPSDGLAHRPQPPPKRKPERPKNAACGHPEGPLT